MITAVLESSPLRRLRRGAAKEDGSVAFEFLLWFPIFLMIFIWAIEGAVLMSRSTMFDRAVERAAREVRLGGLVDPDTGAVSRETFVNQICQAAMVEGNCNDLVAIEMLPVDTDAWGGLPLGPEGGAACVERDAGGDLIRPATDFEPGIESQLMVVRVCALTRVLFKADSPNPFVYRLPTDDEGGVYVSAVTVFVVEPS